ncbi:MAG: hypothetical protein C0601_08295 [Candidatus Muiribacterium halophilum]|uniref:Uncharacterized protein n=1 Tax=Muiribacterium halophilum TaxID=2053465 RepID=A0A2N5ZEP4_MUIH1|nr:MAG: hypothetical protein C0601_08295 [Candidatus Muirbacterium halophilum]
MRLKLDLLPQERKSIARDFKAWIILGVFVLLTFLWYLPVKSYMISKGEELKKTASELALKQKVESNELTSMNDIISSPIDLGKSIVFLVDFLEEASYSWYEFFDSIESARTKELWIDDISKKDINDFVITGKATDNYNVSEFYHKLLSDERFSKVYLLKSELLTDTDVARFQFSINVILKEANI